MIVAGARKAGVGAALVWAAILLGLAPATANAAEPDPAASMYTANSVVAIDLTLPPASIEALEDDPTGDYQPGTFSLASSDGTPGGRGEFSPPLTVGIRLKGKAGSFLPLGEKAAFKIKFSFVKGQKFLGLKKMTLNNMVQDPSMLHETLAYEAFRAAGVPGSRTGYAFVRLNGEVLGVYLNIEDLDDVGLEKRFGSFEDPPQHLYEGEYGTDVTIEDVDDFEVDEGDEEDRGDLEALIAAANDGLAPDWSERMEPVADLTEMSRMWAVEKYIGHWDGYAGADDDDAHDLPNNFYLYSNPAGRFQMLPWGTDQTWESHVAFDGPGGRLLNGCLGDESCAETYRGAATEVLESVSALDFDSLARCTAKLLGPWQALEQEPVRRYGPGQIAAAVAATRDFTGERPGELADWLDLELPEPSAGPNHCPEPEPPLPPILVAPIAPGAVPAPVATSPRLDRGWVSRGALVARFQVPAAGKLDLRAALKTRRGSTLACAASASTTAAGAVTVRCPLSELALRRLEARWLRLYLDIGFASLAAPSTRIGSVVRLRRVTAS